MRINWRDNDRVNRGFQGVLTVAAEVGWLLPFSFQFFTRLAAFVAFESMCFFHCGTGGRRLLVYTYPSTINFE